MAIYLMFTSTISNVDVEALETAIGAIVPGCVVGRIPMPVDPKSGGAGLRWTVKCSARRDDQPFTEAERSAIQAAFDAAVPITTQRAAQYEIDRLPLTTRAILLTLLDQINVLRAGAGLATVTPAQAVAAVRTKAGTL